MKYRKRTGGKRFFASPFIIVGLIIVLLVLIKATSNIRHKALVSAEKLAAAKAELDKLTAHEKDLEQHVDYLSSERGIEAELRTKYRAIKEGESVAVIVDDDDEAPAASSSPDVAQVYKTPWWRKIFQALGI